MQNKQALLRGVRAGAWATGATIVLVALPGFANADCSALPTILANGNTADASQVMGNFNCILQGPRFTGSVSIGGFSTTGYELDVVGDGRFVSPNSGSTGGVIIRDTSGDPNANYLQFVNYENSAQYGFIRGESGGGLLLGGGSVGVGVWSSSYTFYVSGSAAGTTAWANVSDGRLKKNVTDLTGALAIVERLRPIRFDWRLPEERSIGKDLPLPAGHHEIGLVAQEVEAVVPEAVNHPQGINDVYTMKEAELVPVLLAAVKEQQVEIKGLQTELAALRSSR